jgi:hypothetical protein
MSEQMAEIIDGVLFSGAFDRLLAQQGGASAPPSSAYPASPVKRRRATGDEMEARAAFFIAYARAHHPVTVRGLYYQAEVHGVPGIDKTDAGYDKVQAQVLKLRRAGRLDYAWIADATRWMQDALLSTAALYRRNLWRDADTYVEVWCEKDALAGTIYPVTSLYDVPLIVARGFSSETFCFEAVAARGDDRRPYHVIYLGDFDRAGQDAAQSLEEKLRRFAAEKGIEIAFDTIAVTPEQVRSLNLPTRPPKRVTAADRRWPHTYACEVDAVPPDHLRALVEDAINEHLPQDEFKILKQAEASERNLLTAWAREKGGEA